MIKRFPLDRQMDAKDCGPACIKMIAKYFGKYYSLPYLRDLCGITREGVSFLDISYGAEKIGLHTLSIKLSINDLRNRISLPCIVHWEGNHFVVVYKVTKKTVFVADPAKGFMSYSYEEFIRGWYKNGEDKGVLMCLEPMADFTQRTAESKQRRLKNIQTTRWVN